MIVMIITENYTGGSNVRDVILVGKSVRESKVAIFERWKQKNQVTDSAALNWEIAIVREDYV